MGREIVTVQIGQAGVQIGNALWELYCMEHGVTAAGTIKDELELSPTNRIGTLFYETKDGKCIPRSIFMDLEPTVVDEIRSGSYRNLFNPSCLISGMEDAASNYARGFYNLGKVQIETFMNSIRKMANNCDHLSLFEIINSYDGGTGSGVTSLLLERLSEDFCKEYRFETGIFPSATLSQSTVGPYNSLLYTHSTFENLDCGILVDNESIYKKLCDQLHCLKPTFSMINRFLAQMMSCIFLSHRYNSLGSQHMDIDELMTNAVPYPRIHFPVLAYAPIFNANQLNHEITKPLDLVRYIFQTNSHFLNCPMQLTKYISCCLLFRGAISPKEVYEAVASVKSDSKVQFVDWCPTGFKIGINGQPSLSTPNNALAASKQSLCMLSGNVGIKEAWRNLRAKYQHLISKRAFIHWFVGEGLEENDFQEANEDIQVLENDYEEIAKDTNPSAEVVIETVASEKVRSNSNTNNHLHHRGSSSSQYHQIDKPPHLSRNNCHPVSYSKVLFEDVVSRLDTKLNSTNSKMVKKLDKLQCRLNRINQIYVNSKSSEDDEKGELKRSTSLSNHETSSSESKTIKDNVIFIKRLIRRQTMGNLGFSSKEEVECLPINTTCQHLSNNSLDTDKDVSYGTDQKSVTTKVTSDTSNCM